MGEQTGGAVAGRYHLVEVLGEGGMGKAWRAWDERMAREVVLKQLKMPLGLAPEDRDKRVARMEREGRAAGKLKHPHIVTVYDQFHDDDGLPWLVMESVRGDSLERLLKKRGPLPETEVARIGARIADALAAAHEAGIVHRDVKPANVLLEGERVVITDFGIAAVTGEGTLTSHGSLLGTPAYMSPEQINGLKVTASSDLWSLGATLYTALEGRPPFEAESYAALLLAVSRDEPAPTTRADTLAPVLEQLMSRDPTRRPTAARAAVLLADPTAATTLQQPAPTLSPPTLSSPTLPVPPPEPDPAPVPAPAPAPRRAGAFTRRGFLVLLGVAGGGAAAVAVSRLTGGGDTDPEPPAFPRWEGTPVPYGGPLTGHTGYVWTLAFSPDSAFLATGGKDKTVRLWDVAAGTPHGAPLTGHGGHVSSVAFSPDGKVLATGSWDESVRLWDVATGTPLGAPLTGHGDRVSSVAFSHDGKVLATGGWDKKVRLWDVAARRSLGEPLTGHTRWVQSVAFGGGTVLATGGADGKLRLWDTATRAPLDDPLDGHDGGVWSVDFHPDGVTLATGGADGKVRLWDTAARVPLGKPLDGHTNEVYSVAFSPDGGTLASGSWDKTVRLWSAPSGTPVGSPLTGHTHWVEAVAFSPDGRLLASCGDDKTARLWRQKR